ncbi:hypothetical protein GF382_02585 [Candidatus Falkowbacteria bacterium]|nr:hypothetical protein [Candidatus Falkowbacteria bacterium]
MDIVIDLSFISDFLSLPPEIILTRLFFYFGWIPLAIVFLWGALQVWIYHINIKWGEKNAKYTLLAIDIPRGNEQSPKAVENLFSYLAGAHGSINLIEKYWEGKFQLAFSFEVISIEGYTQFVIHTPVAFRNLVESAVYSQYPDAEITEVDDYTDDFADLRFPNEEYDLWGAEFIQAKPPAYPIKTYKEFEHQFGEPETHFKDPMATLMDLTSSLKRGEQLWYQIVVIPTGFDWIERCDREVSNILGEKIGGGPNIFGKLADVLLDIIKAVGSAVSGSEASESATEDADPLRMMNLKPKQKKQVESIEAKTAHFAFDFKIRMVYLAKKDVMQRAKVVNGFVGYMKQFAALDLNNLKPDMSYTATTASYLFAEKRKNKRKNNIFRNYINRSTWGGRVPGFLNVEELATLWHFPNEGVVKAPLIQKAPGRKAEPPMTLPQAEEIVGENVVEPLFGGGPEDEEEFAPKKETERSSSEDQNDDIFIEDGISKDSKKEPVDEKGAPPGNLPIG